VTLGGEEGDGEAKDQEASRKRKEKRLRPKGHGLRGKVCPNSKRKKRGGEKSFPVRNVLLQEDRTSLCARALARRKVIREEGQKRGNFIVINRTLQSQVKRKTEVWENLAGGKGTASRQLKTAKKKRTADEAKKGEARLVENGEGA